MQRESRVITEGFINFIVPFTLVGLLAIFVPYVLVIVPIDESNVCWLYYLTRSPYQMESISDPLYYSSYWMYYIINSIEIILLVIFRFKIYRMSGDDRIDIATESKVLLGIWGYMALANIGLNIY